jgi:hypothetical protein
MLRIMRTEEAAVRELKDSDRGVGNIRYLSFWRFGGRYLCTGGRLFFSGLFAGMRLAMGDFRKAYNGLLFGPAFFLFELFDALCAGEHIPVPA